MQAKIFHRVDDRPDVPCDWIIFNAPRPMTGDKEWQSDFVHGVFYAAIDPSGEFAKQMIDSNTKLDGWIIQYWNRDEAIAIAKADYHKHYPKQGKIIEGLSDDQILQAFDNLKNKER